MPKFSCPHCDQHIDADEELAGEAVECPSCQATIVVPVEQLLSRPLQGEPLPDSGPPSPSAPDPLKQTRRVLAPVAPVDAGGAVVNPAPQPRPAPGSGSLGWDLAIGAATALALAFGFSLLDLPSLRTGAPAAPRSIQQIGGETAVLFLAIVGVALVVGLVIAIGAAVLRKSFGGTFVRAFTTTAVLAAIFTPVAVYLSRQGHLPALPYQAAAPENAGSAKAMVEGLESDMKAMASELRAPDGAPKTTDLHFDTGSAAPTNDFERTRSLLQSFFNDLVGLQNTYLAALDQAGISKVLDPARLSEDAEFRDTHAMVAALRKVVEDFRGKAETLMKSFPERVEATSYTSEVKQNILSGYHEGLGRSIPVFQETWQLESASLDRVAEIVAFLDASRGRWSVDNGEVVFQGNDDLEKFRQIMAKLDEGMKRQSDLREKTLQAASGALGDMKLALPK
jgi:hypothetical protein